MIQKFLLYRHPARVCCIDGIVANVGIEIEVIFYGYDRKQGATANLHVPNQPSDRIAHPVAAADAVNLSIARIGAQQRIGFFANLRTYGPAPYSYS